MQSIRPIANNIMTSLCDDSLVRNLAPVAIMATRQRMTYRPQTEAMAVRSYERAVHGSYTVAVVLRGVTVVHRDPQTVNAPSPRLPTD